jgi:protein gp37
MAKTKIEWCDATWNPMSGCSKISDGCKFCFAERMAHRLQAMGTKGYEKGFEVTLHPERLKEPWHWKKPRRVFVCSMGDLFHDDVPESFIIDVISYAEQYSTWLRGSESTFIFLTKRPERMADIWKKMFSSKSPIRPESLWFGVSISNQKDADRWITIILQIPAAKRLVSVEPMLENINLGYYLRGGFRSSLPPIDWVIAGCESGPHRRPFDLDWARDLRDQCKAAQVAFFIKQLNIAGKVSHDINEWPEDLRIRQIPGGQE